MLERYRVYPGKESAHTLAEPERLKPNIEVETPEGANDTGRFWREWEGWRMAQWVLQDPNRDVPE